MENHKDRFGEKLGLVERAREDIYFAARDRELIAQLKAKLEKVKSCPPGGELFACPKCRGKLEGYSFMEILLDRCQSCGGIWLDQGELEATFKRVTEGPGEYLLEHFLTRGGRERTDATASPVASEKGKSSGQETPVAAIMMREPVTIGPEDTLDLANDVMSLGLIRHLPVLDEGRIVGVLSQRDLFRSSAIGKAVGSVYEAQKKLLKTVKIKEVMASPVITAAPDATIKEAAVLMVERRIGCLPIVARGRLVGLVTQTDILRHIVNL